MSYAKSDEKKRERSKLRSGQCTDESRSQRCEAWAMGGHSVMVMVEGVSSGVLLESVKPCLSNV